ncbi:microtubule-associated protein futsch-like [Penaeus indicus]|uniref:microtubule-associated protein futsch-like n=1 Tax=Penaeus indicus TaxID=29960 RepID=UPI00300D0B37
MDRTKRAYDQRLGGRRRGGRKGSGYSPIRHGSCTASAGRGALRDAETKAPRHTSIKTKETEAKSTPDSKENKTHGAEVPRKGRRQKQGKEFSLQEKDFPSLLPGVQAGTPSWPRVQSTKVDASLGEISKISPGDKASVGKRLKKVTATRPGASTPATEDSKTEASGNKGRKAPVAKDLSRKATKTSPGASTPATEDSKIEASGDRGRKAPVAKDLSRKATKTLPGVSTPATASRHTTIRGDKTKETEAKSTPDSKENKTHGAEVPRKGRRQKQGKEFSLQEKDFPSLLPGVLAGTPSWPRVQSTKVDASLGEISKISPGDKASVGKRLKKEVTATRPGASTLATEDSKIEASGNKGRKAPVAKDLSRKATKTLPGVSTPATASRHTTIRGDKTKETETKSTPDSKEKKTHGAEVPRKGRRQKQGKEFSLQEKDFPSLLPGVQAGTPSWPRVQSTKVDASLGDISKISPGDKASVGKRLKKVTATRPGASTLATEDSKIEASGNKGRKAPVAKDLSRKATKTLPGVSTPATASRHTTIRGDKTKETEAKSTPDSKENKTHGAEVPRKGRRQKQGKEFSLQEKDFPSLLPGVQAGTPSWPRVQSTKVDASLGDISKISPGDKASVGKRLKKVTATRPGASTLATEDSKIEASGNKGRKAPVAKDLSRKATKTLPGVSTPATASRHTTIRGDKTKETEAKSTPDSKENKTHGAEVPRKGRRQKQGKEFSLQEKDFPSLLPGVQAGTPSWPRVQSTKVDASLGDISKISPGDKASVGKRLKKVTETRPGVSTPVTKASKSKASGNKGRKDSVAKDLKRKATENRSGASTPATRASGNKESTESKDRATENKIPRSKAFKLNVEDFPGLSKELTSEAPKTKSPVPKPPITKSPVPKPPITKSSVP